MSSKFIMFVVFLWLSGNILCMIIEGSYFNEGDMDILEALTGYSAVQISGTGAIAIPKLAVGFFTVGLPRMLLWDYNFLQGGWELFRVFLYIISVGVLAPVAMAALSFVGSLFSR